MSKSNKDGVYTAADIAAIADSVTTVSDNLDTVIGLTTNLAHSATGDVTGFTAGSGTASKSDSVWGGASGSTKYTVGDIVTALKAAGILFP